jgi:hypothetical protein
MTSPDLLDELSGRAVRSIAATCTPLRSAEAFIELWRGLIAAPPARPDFRAIVGDDPASWFLATQCRPGESWTAPQRQQSEQPAKGVLAHFAQAFPGDLSLARLARECGGTFR